MDEIKRSAFARLDGTKSSSVMDIENGVRVIAHTCDHESVRGRTFYEAQYLHLFSDEWITPWGKRNDIYLYSDLKKAVGIAMKQKEWVVSKITRDFIQREINAETRRKYMEYMGTSAFVERLDLELVHQELDNYAKPMKLYRMSTADPSLRGVRPYFLMVTDTSTNRVYYLSVREAKTCSEAKRSTFRNVSLFARQGDVGIVKLDRDGKIINQERTIET